MKMLQKICVGAIVLFISSTQIKAQSSAGFTVSATIVNPVGLRSEVADDYTKVSIKTQNNGMQGPNSKYEVSIAALNIDAAAEDVYSITLPGEMALRNKSGNSCITAVVNPGSLVAGQLLPNGQKRFNVNSELILNKGHSGGKHSSAPFEVIVNFN